MGRYAVTFSVDGDFPPIPSVSPIEVGDDVELRLENNRWLIRVVADAESHEDAIQAAKSFGRDKLTLFQIFLAGSSSGFRMSLPENAGCQVENLSSSERSVRSNMVVISVAEISASVGLVVTSNIRPAVEALSKIYPMPANQNDCQIVLYYYKRAIGETELLYKFLNYVTAIEAMLSEGSETTEKISRRLAVIVSSRFTNMQETFEEFKGYYDTRSRILHGDKIPDLSKATVDKVAELARTTIRNYLLLRKQSSEENVKRKLDKFFDARELELIRQTTAF